MITFSVVTPSYNQGRFIERTIHSVLDQQYPQLEYVICDACSTDETPLIVQKYTTQLKLIREPDGGQADAVNKGIQATRGELIGWLNSDDVYQPGALVTVAAYFSRHTDVDVVYGDANLIDADDRQIGRYYTERWDRRRLPSRPFLCQPAVFFRRRVVDHFGLLDPHLQYTLDYEYWLRLAAGGARFAYLPLTLASSRLHPETKTHTQGLRSHYELNVMLKRYVSAIPDSWILTQTHTELRQDDQRHFNNPFVFAVAVALVSWRLSLQLNRSVSIALMISTLRTLAAGALKTALGMPVVQPTN
jgi:glycosyltransferase involved in cell wall biosynthesis